MENKKIKVKFCPICDSSNVILWMGGTLGVQYKCKKCGYLGPLIVEKDIEKSD